MRSFRDIVNESDLIDQDQKRVLLSQMSVKKVSKGEVLQRKGDLKQKAFYVRHGILRSYTIDEKGKEHIYMFGAEGWIVSDIEMQTKNAAAKLYIDVVEEAEVEIVDVTDFNEMARLLFDNRSAEEVTRLLRRVAVLQERVIMLMSATVTERYEHFVKTYPDIVQRVPQKMIASYLGVTPEALSKVKGDILRSH